MTQKSDGYTVYTGTKVAKVGGPQFLSFDQKLLLPSSFFHFLSKKVWRRCVDKPKVCGFKPGQLTSWLVWWLLFALYICHLSIKMLLDLLRIRTHATSLPGIRELPRAGAHHGGCQPAVPWLKDLRPKISEYPNILPKPSKLSWLSVSLSSVSKISWFFPLDGVETSVEFSKLSMPVDVGSPLAPAAGCVPFLLLLSPLASWGMDQEQMDPWWSKDFPSGNLT